MQRRIDMIDDINFNQSIITISSNRPIYVNENKTIRETVDIFLKFDIRRLPVVDKKRKLVGIVTVTDIINAFLRDENFDKKISSIMNRPIFCYQNEKIKDVIKKFKFSKKGGFPVTDKNKTLVGIVTEHDIIDFLKQENIKIPIKEIMTEKPFFLKPMDFLDSLMLISNTGYRKFPVIEDNRIIGILTARQCLGILKSANFSRKNINFNLKDAVIRDVPIFSDSDPISKLIDYTREYKVGGGLVIENNNLKGIVTERDILEKIII
ncbi:MAG: hypothetical protein B6U88_01915 [Candidatus Aenigmarchaeota archaeon ex4484_56]|nr:MAG: hypothetical protein B6U88_01915 [Candidatus Aenigmarchaeota archaeon ex4484_56]